MNALMKSISFLINQDVRKLIEKVCDEFPEVPLTKILLILQDFYDSELPEEEEESIKDCETNTCLMQRILNLINQKIWKIAERVHEEFPQIQIREMLSIWCEMQQICGLEFPDKQCPIKAPLQDEEVLRKTGQYRKIEQDCNTKTCEHVYI
jgi:hypothetical protein